MGAQQSVGTNQDEPKLSQTEVQNLLNAQRKVYEQKCQEYMEKAAAESARATQTQQAKLTLQTNLTLQLQDNQTQQATLAQQVNQTHKVTPAVQQISQCMPMLHSLQQTTEKPQQVNLTQQAKLPNLTQPNLTQATPVQWVAQGRPVQHPIQQIVQKPQQDNLSQQAKFTQQPNLTQQVNLTPQTKLTQQINLTQQANLNQQANVTQKANLTKQISLTQQTRLTQHTNLAQQANQTQNATLVLQQVPQCIPVQHTIQQTIQKPQQANHTQQAKQTQKATPVLQQTIQKPQTANQTQQVHPTQRANHAQQVKSAQQANQTLQAKLAQQAHQTLQAKLTPQANQSQQVKLTQQANLAHQTKQTQQATPLQQKISQCISMQHPLQQTTQKQQPLQKTMSAQQQIPQSRPVQQNITRPAQQAMPTSNLYGPAMPTRQTPQTKLAPSVADINARFGNRKGPNAHLSAYIHTELINMLNEKASASANLNNVGASSSATVLHVTSGKNNTIIESYLLPNSNKQIQKSQLSVPSPPSARDPSASRNQSSATPHSARSRSASRSRKKNVNDALKCPVCKEMFGLQIFQCNRGHSMCKKCHEYRRSCVTCGGTSTGRRNIDLEKYVGETKVPCPHSKEGCRLYIKVADMEFHVKECPFQELKCPAGCSWKGHIKQLFRHYDLSHPEQRKADVDSEMRLLYPKNSQNTYLVLIGSFNFLFHVKVSNGAVYMTAQLIGTKIGASKWSYEIHVFNMNENHKKFVFTDTCSSFVEPVAEIFKGGKCCILPNIYVSAYVNNGLLSYKFFIKQKAGSKPKDLSDLRLLPDFCLSVDERALLRAALPSRRLRAADRCEALCPS